MARVVTPVTRLGRTCDSENVHRYWVLSHVSSFRSTVRMSDVIASCHTCDPSLTWHGRFPWQCVDGDAGRARETVARWTDTELAAATRMARVVTPVTRLGRTCDSENVH